MTLIVEVEAGFLLPADMFTSVTLLFSSEIVFYDIENGSC